MLLMERRRRQTSKPLRDPAESALPSIVLNKYKSKAFIDAFVYRSGDVIGAQMEGALGRLGLGLGALAAVAVPLALVWVVLGLWLGRAQHRLAASGTIETSAAASPPYPPESRSPS